MALALPLSAAQAKIVEVLNSRMMTSADLTKMLGTGYTELKVQSMVLTLARKGKIERNKAMLILRGTEMAKFINYPAESHLKGGIPANRGR